MQRKFIIFVVIITLTGLVLASCGVEKKEIRLAFKYQSGQKRQYTNTIKASSQLDESGKLVKTSEVSYKSTINEEVLGIPDSGGARIRLTNIIDDITSPKSDSAKIDPSAVKWIIEYLMTSNGRIADIYPQDSTSRNITGFYKNYYEQALPVFPDRPVSEGYSWSQTVKVIIQKEGTTKAETNYEVRSFVREAGYNCAVIEYKGNLILPFQNTGQDGSLAIGLEKITSSGVIYFGYEAGLIVRQEEAYDIQSEGTKTRDGQSRKFNLSSKRTSSLILTE
jgi:hypothetical protein